MNSFSLWVDGDKNPKSSDFDGDILSVIELKTNKSKLEKYRYVDKTPNYISPNYVSKRRK